MPKRGEAETKSEVLKGTLDMLVLHTLTIQPMHGYAIVQHIKRLTEDALEVEGGIPVGSLYPRARAAPEKGMVTPGGSRPRQDGGLGTTPPPPRDESSSATSC